MYPQGFSNLLLDKKSKYSHKKALAMINTNTSESNPSAIIFAKSKMPKDAVVMG